MLGTETVIVGGDFVRDEDGRVTQAVGIGAVDNCQVQPMSAKELVDRGRDGDEDAVSVFLPITAGLDRTSTLTVRGVTYSIDGNPQPYVNPEDPDLSGYSVTATRRAG